MPTHGRRSSFAPHLPVTRRNCPLLRPALETLEDRSVPAAFDLGALTRPADLTRWQVSFVARQMPASPEARCADSIAVSAPDAARAGGGVAVRRPGPYVYWTFEHTVHWVRVNDSAAEPVPHPCAQNPDPSVRSPAPTGRREP